MLLILYMEYLERLRQPPTLMDMRLSYRDWLDAVTEEAECQGLPIATLCAPPPWQLGQAPKPSRGI